MISFLTSRPIAVSMVYLALMILGLVAVFYMPVSLLPDIAVPEVSVEVDAAGKPAREVHDSYLEPLRGQLMQLAKLEDLQATSRDGQGRIRLRFRHGTDVDYAFMAANEKVDRALHLLPPEAARPRVIKASASDVPVCYINVMLRDTAQQEGQARFLGLSRFCGQVVRKRIEQIPEVAMADMSGFAKPEIVLYPKTAKIRALGLHISDLHNAITQRNISIGNLLVREGHYQYTIRVKSFLQDKESIGQIPVGVHGQSLPLHTLADIKLRPQARTGLVHTQGQGAVTFAIIKRAGSRMAALDKALDKALAQFRKDYPHLRIEKTRDQTRLLDYAIRNLRQTLFWGAGLAFLMVLFFLRDLRSPLLIGIAIPASLIVSVLFFYLAGLSINIISLSGLVLGIGLMIDNAIIVIDNINQYREKGLPLKTAVTKGTNEIIRPLLSSVLTTCAVFLPLIFISGMAGALFYDQAVAVAIGLVSSFVVSITLLPVYFYSLFRHAPKDGAPRFLQNLRLVPYTKVYEKGLRFVLRRQLLAWVLFLVVLPAGAGAYYLLDKHRLPPTREDEILVHIDWNQRIHLQTNRQRCESLLAQVGESLSGGIIYAGQQQFMLQNQGSSPAEAQVYIKCQSHKDLSNVQNRIEAFMREKYPEAKLGFHTPESLFQLVFSEEEAPLVAYIRPAAQGARLHYKGLQQFYAQAAQALPAITLPPVPLKAHTNILIDPAKAVLLGIPFGDVVGKIKALFNASRITTLAAGQEFIPVVVGENSKALYEKLQRASLEGPDGAEIPLRELIQLKPARGLRTIQAGQGGEFFPLRLWASGPEAVELRQAIDKQARQAGLAVDWGGSLRENKRLVRQIMLILAISLALLYFILAAQFESVRLPLIILIEVPIDIAGALLLLWLTGSSINIMSLIGLIVMSGIIINDSILKIDTMNRIYRQTGNLLQAIVVGGHRRLKPILMTSLTTIMAMVPFLFAGGLGADLQKPLAISLIGGMTLGTAVSLFFIPLIYFELNRKR